MLIGPHKMTSAVFVVVTNADDGHVDSVYEWWLTYVIILIIIIIVILLPPIGLLVAYYGYRLARRALLHSLWESWRGFSISSNLNGSGWNLEYKWGVTVCTHTNNSGEIAPGVTPKDVKTCFVFVTNTMRTLGHLSYLHRFWSLLK